MRIYIQVMGRIDALPNGAAATACAEPSTTWPGQIGREVRLDADRPDAGAAAAMGNAEGLVQIHVADIGADVAGPGQPDQRIEIGAVEIDLPAMGVDDGADVPGTFLEHAVRRG